MAKIELEFEEITLRSEETGLPVKSVPPAARSAARRKTLMAPDRRVACAV